MDDGIEIISLPLPLHVGRVNIFLIRTQAGHLLIDTGPSYARKELLSRLEGAGCTPMSLHLIVLTHGDFDHTGNAAHLRSTFGARLAMHADDLGMAERGDMFANRRKSNALLRSLMPVLSGFGASERFSPDILLRDGLDLSPYGMEAKVIELPGHSKGSVGVLTAGGSLFCGDLLESTKRPALNSLMDDPAAARASVAKLRAMKLRTVYPGHGRPFPLERLSERARARARGQLPGRAPWAKTDGGMT